MEHLKERARLRSSKLAISIALIEHMFTIQLIDQTNQNKFISPFYSVIVSSTTTNDNDNDELHDAFAQCENVYNNRSIENVYQTRYDIKRRKKINVSLYVELRKA